MKQANEAIKKPSIWLRLLLPSVLVVVWLCAAGFGSSYFEKITDISSNDPATFLPNTAEATKVNQSIGTFYGTDALPAIIAFENKDKLSSTAIKKIDEVRAGLKDVHEVKGDIPPTLVADDGKSALIIVPLTKSEELTPAFSALQTKVSDAETGIDYKIGGPAAFSRDIQSAFSGIDGPLLFVALGVVFIILLVVYRSPFLPFMVLLTSMAALSTSVLTVWYMAHLGWVEINGQVQGILFILVIGAATDYSLLYLARLREELYNHKTILAATRAALKGSYEAILAAGGTVTIGLLCLLLSDLASNKALGPVGGVGIAFAVVSALTFLPAMLLLMGRFAFWPLRPNYAPEKTVDYTKQHKLWARVGRLVQNHPRRLWVGSTLVLLIACIGIFQLKAEGVSQNNIVLGYSEARETQAIIDRHFPSGSGTPAHIVANKDNYQKIIEKLDHDKGVETTTIVAAGSSAASIPVGKAEAALRQQVLDEVTIKRQQQLQELRTSIEKQLAGAPPAAINQAFTTASASIPSAEEIARNAYPFKDMQPKVVGDTVLLEATLTDSSDSAAARDTVVRLRQELKKADSRVLVGGMAAIQYDINQAAFHDQKVIVPAVLIAITIILGVLLRSIIAPILLLFTTIVSFGATIGIAALMFNHVWHFPGADPSMLLFGFIFLVALGIDYNIFLMTRIREEVGRADTKQGVTKALVLTGGVITGAGIVLAATFAALTIVPILFLAQIAFIVAFGVLLDTLLVRSLLTPALSLEVGRRIWWPSKLGKK